MANSFFRFKQFTVYHDRCAMKVGTDGVLLGAWASVEDVRSVLDVGCGSGLISLMIAQRVGDSANIQAIDIDKDACEQTRLNILASPFSNIVSKHQSLLDMEELHTFDLIVSNPPFFKNSLLSPDNQRTLARHSGSLEMEDIFNKSKKLLPTNGILSVVYPYEFKDSLLQNASKCGLKVSRITNVRPTPDGEHKRVLFECIKSNSEIPIVEEDLIIEIERHVYSSEFTKLAKDFYLKL